MEKDDRNFVNIDSNFFGDMRFYFNKDLYTIEDFRNDFTEWKEVMLSKKNISQGYQNFEAFFVIAAHNYLKKNQHFKKKSYYLKYFEGFEIDEKETDIESDFYFINQKGKKLKKDISNIYAYLMQSPKDSSGRLQLYPHLIPYAIVFELKGYDLKKEDDVNYIFNRMFYEKTEEEKLFLKKQLNLLKHEK